MFIPRQFQLQHDTKAKRECENIKRIRYGKINGHDKWDLAKSWLKMSNDDFYRLYGFNWVPPVWMYEEAREYL